MNTERQIIISPLVYLMEEHRDLQSTIICTTPRWIVAGWILELLPDELHKEARRRVADPLLVKIEELIRLSSEKRECS